MSSKLLCIDSDIFTILSIAGRLERVIELLNFQNIEARRLPALANMLSRSKQFKQFSDQQKAIAHQMAERIQPLDLSPSSTSNRDLLSNKVGIDAGEQILFATLAEQPFTWLTSGDARAMRAIASDSSLADIRKAISSRIVSLEAVMYLLIHNDGYPKTAAAFSEIKSHKTLRCFFPQNESLPQGFNPLEGPGSYLRALCTELGRGFLHCPPCPDSHQAVCTLHILQ